MRIKDSERRMLNRRLKDRIAPVIQAGLYQFPRLVLLLTATIYISPEAMAQISDSKSDVTFTTTYTKEDLKPQFPVNPIPNFSEKVGQQVTNFFTSMRDNQNTGSAKLLEIYNAAPYEVDNGKTDLIRASTLRENTPADRSQALPQVRDHLGKEPGKYVGGKFAEIPLIQKIRSGLSFTLDVGKLFRPKTEGATGTIRYGLILKDVTPDQSAPKRAAINDPNDMQYLGHAEVKWSIGPLEPEAAKPFAFDTQIVERPTTEAQASLWDQVKLPSAAFNTSVAPADIDYLKLGKESLPGIKYSLTQVDGYYQLNRVAKATLGTETSEHQVAVPLPGGLSLGRRFQDNFETLETSVATQNLIIKRDAPLIGIHYFNLENRYKFQVNKDIKGHAVGFAVEPRKDWKPSTDLGKEGDKFTATYGKTF